MWGCFGLESKDNGNDVLLAVFTPERRLTVTDQNLRSSFSPSVVGDEMLVLDRGGVGSSYC